MNKYAMVSVAFVSSVAGMYASEKIGGACFLLACTIAVVAMLTKEK